MIRGMRRVVRVAEFYLRDHSFEHFHEVFVGAFDCLARSDPGGGVRDEYIAESFGNTRLIEALFDLPGDIERLLVAMG